MRFSHLTKKSLCSTSIFAKRTSAETVQHKVYSIHPAKTLFRNTDDRRYSHGWLLFLLSLLGGTLSSKRTVKANADQPTLQSIASRGFLGITFGMHAPENDQSDEYHPRISSLPFKSVVIHRFEIDNAHVCCALSRLVYAKKDEIEKTLNAWGFPYQRVIYDSEMDLQVLIAGDDRKIIIAYRGTQSAQNWKTNFNAIRFDSPSPIGGNLHAGFKNAAIKLWPEVRKTLHEFRKNEQQIWFTGHSLGGAISTISAAYHASENDFLIGRYTFGEPRCGDDTFSEAFQKKRISSHYLINAHDPVPVILPRTLGCARVGALIFLNENGRLLDDCLNRELLKNFGAEAKRAYNVTSDFLTHMEKPKTEAERLEDCKKALNTAGKAAYKTIYTGFQVAITPICEFIRTFSVPYSVLFETADHGIDIYESKLRGLVQRKNEGLSLYPEEVLASTVRHEAISNRS